MSTIDNSYIFHTNISLSRIFINCFLHIFTDEIQPTGTVIPKIKRVRMRFGHPLDFSRYANSRGDRFVERAITDEIMYELMALSGRPYVDVYASKLKTSIEAPGLSHHRAAPVGVEGAEKG